MPSPIPGVDIAQAGLGIVDTAIGLLNAGKTKRNAEELARTRPKYQTSPEIGQDLSLAESDLSNGMSSAASNAYNDINNQQFSNSIGAILKSGGTPNNIGDIYGNNQDGRLKLSMMKDNLRLQQIQNFARASQAKTNEEQTQWQVDEYAPWSDRAVANGAERTNAQGQINTGLNTVGSAIGNIDQSIREGRQFNTNTSYVPSIANPQYSTTTPTTSNPQYNSQYTLTPRTESYGFNPQL